MSEEGGAHYPRLIKSVGEAPKQYGSTVIGKHVPEDGEETFVEEEDIEGMETEGEEGSEVDSDTDIVAGPMDEFNMEEAETEDDAPSDSEEI